MATESFSRHTRRCVDAATHRVFAAIRRNPYRHAAFERLLVAAHERSDLMRTPPRGDAVVQVEALRALAWFQRGWLGAPEDWPGAQGHPLRVVDSLASHLFGPYPTPRFLASAWFGEPTIPALQHRRWFIAHGRGTRFRDLPLPIAMTRKMEHIFLRTPDHLPVDRALRRAEIFGLGGGPALAEALMATRLGKSFDDAAHWRAALAWFVRVEDDLDLAQVGPIVDYLHAMRGRALSLRGGVPSMRRAMTAWHAELNRLPQARYRPVRLSWPRSRWHELVHAATGREQGPERRVVWRLVELIDSDALAAEGRAMRHCVATYASRCVRGAAAIWSLRRIGGDDDGEARSVLTIEVDPRTATIVQVKAAGNARPRGGPAELVRAWAARERLTFGGGVLWDLSND